MSPANAIRAYREHLLSQPNDFDSRLTLAELLIENKEFDQAIAVCSKLLEDLGDNDREISIAAKTAIILSSVYTTKIAALADAANQELESGGSQRAEQLCSEGNHLIQECNLLTWFLLNEENLTSAQLSEAKLFSTLMKRFIADFALIDCTLGVENQGRYLIMNMISATWISDRTTEGDKPFDIFRMLASSVNNACREAMPGGDLESALAKVHWMDELLSFVPTEHLPSDWDDLQSSKVYLLGHLKRFEDAKSVVQKMSESDFQYDNNLWHFNEVIIEQGILEHKGNQAFEAGLWENAAENFIQAEKIPRPNAYIEQISGELSESVIKKGTAGFDAINARLLARAAIAYKKAGKWTAARAVLNYLRSKYPAYNPDKVEEIAKAISGAEHTEKRVALTENASRYFEEKQWSKSTDAYLAVARFVSESGSDGSSALVAESIYSAAASEFNRKEFVVAIRMLDFLSKKHPTYDPENVKRLKRKAKFAELRKIAGRYFDDERWEDAVNAYIKAGKYAQSLNRGDWDDAVAECRFNIAKAYKNNRRYKDALDVLKQIRREHPRYNVSEVRDKISESERKIVSQYSK